MLLRLRAHDLLAELLDLLAQLGFLSVAYGPAHLEETLLARHQPRHLGAVAAGHEIGRKLDDGYAVAFRLVSRLPGGVLVERLRDDTEAGPCLGSIQA